MQASWLRKTPFFPEEDHDSSIQFVNYLYLLSYKSLYNDTADLLQQLSGQDTFSNENIESIQVGQKALKKAVVDSSKAKLFDKEETLPIMQSGIDLLEQISTGKTIKDKELLKNVIDCKFMFGWDINVP